MPPTMKSLVSAITKHPDNAAERLKTLRLIVAERLDGTDSARETASLSRCVLDIEAALRSLSDAGAEVDEVAALRARRQERGAQ